MGGHKADSHCPVSEPLAIQEGQASFLEECLPACRADGMNLNSPNHSCKRLSSSPGHLAQYVGVRAERFPMPDKRDGTHYFLTAKRKKPETEIMLLLETFGS